MREGLTVTTNRGATMVVRATKYPVTGRGGKGYAVLQRGSLDAILHEEARPVRDSHTGRPHRGPSGTMQTASDPASWL